MEIVNSPDRLSVMGHLDELRQRILGSLLGLGAGSAIGLMLVKSVIVFLKRPAAALIQEYILLKPTEVVAIYMKVALYCGAILASPLLLYHAWQFLKPAIPPLVKTRLWLWLTAACLLFILGTGFAYTVLVPKALIFLMGLSRTVATPMVNLNDYISFVLAIMLVGGVIFEIPVVVGLLTRLQIVHYGMLKRRRKEAIFVLCVIAAVITPTTDAFNMLIFVVPMIALYELGIWVSWAMARNQTSTGKDVYPHENQ